MKSIKENHVADLLFITTLFCVFAVCAILLVVFGAGTYHSTVDAMERNFNDRTAVAYVSEKLRQRDIEGSVKVQEIDGVNTLSLVRQYDASAVYTYVYVKDGYLMELTLTSLVRPDLSAGSKIMELNALNITELTDGVVKVEIEGKSGEKDVVFLAAKCNPGMDGMTIEEPLL